MSSAQLHRRVRRLEVVHDSSELLIVFLSSCVGDVGEPVRITRAGAAPTESWTPDPSESADAFRDRVAQIQMAKHARLPFDGNFVALCVQNRASSAEQSFPGKTLARTSVGVDQ